MSGYGKPTSKRNLRDKTLHKKGVDPHLQLQINFIFQNFIYNKILNSMPFQCLTFETSCMFPQTGRGIDIFEWAFVTTNRTLKFFFEDISKYKS